MKVNRFVPLLFLLGILLASATIDLNNLLNYANQTKPVYITKNNTPANNQISNAGATLGRVLFYDKNLSANNTIACASCHKQQFAFGDTAQLSVGLNGGLTGRHSMRLINAKFGVENKFFWDERATSLEDQTTKPIQDHVEMGYSGTSGQEDLNDLIVKLQSIDYYNTLFKFVYGDSVITETRIQNSLAQFIRSIQSFDSKFDQGLAAAANLNANFSNFTAEENAGKTLFLAPPNQNGAGCQGCHRAPEFDIDPNTLNNGVIAVAGSTALDLTNTKAPTLRDLFNPTGSLNGHLMHNGNFNNLLAVVNHYNLVPQNANNTNLDPRLQGPGGNLQLTETEKNALVAFIRTLTGTDVYSNEKWSNPFDTNGNLDLIPLITGIEEIKSLSFSVFPNPSSDFVYFNAETGYYNILIFDFSGKQIESITCFGNEKIDISYFNKGTYLLSVRDLKTQNIKTEKIIKK